MSENNENQDSTPVEKSNFLGLNDNIAALLAYLFGPLTGVIWYFAEKKNKFVKFHAAQSIVLGVLCIIVGWIFGAIYGGLASSYTSADALNTALNFLATGRIRLPFYIRMFYWLQSIINIFLGGCSIFLMYKAYKNEEYKLPFLGKFVDKLTNK